MMRTPYRLTWLIALTLWLVLPVLAGAETITAKEITVFDGNKGWVHDGITYRLACGVNLVQAANGDLLMTWLSGTDSEPSTDNCILVARSTDGGFTWSEPSIIVPAAEDAGGLTNIFRGEDGQLVGLGAYWPSEEEYTVWYYFRMTSDDNGQTWSTHEPFTLFDNHASLGQRIKLDDGRWLFPASIFLKREQPLHGDLETLAKTATEEQAQALAKTIAEPNPDKFARVLHGCLSVFADDASAGNLTLGGQVANRPMGLIEPTVVQLKDGTVVMLMRAQSGGFLWESRSSDRGMTWSPAVQSDIPNPSALAQLLRLRDGRIALFHNPSGGKVGKRGPRDPLAMWISDDEMKTWSVKQNLAGGGQCAYPNALETDDGRLLVGYDRNRREARVIHVSFE
ncbi:MAG: exo-alpha-sialidase [Phycisphaeraceae bacterium]|nr:exo-alpha-sialidase [Phycisphaeraceae bacterium]